jgi:hypothetical protein
MQWRREKNRQLDVATFKALNDLILGWGNYYAYAAESRCAGYLAHPSEFLGNADAKS